MLYYKATAGCGLGWVGVSGARAPPPSAYPVSRSGVAAPSTVPPRPRSALITLTGPIRIPCSVVPPLRSSSSTYRTRSPFRFRGPRRVGVMSYPPGLLTPRRALPSHSSITPPSRAEFVRIRRRRWRLTATFCCAVRDGSCAATALAIHLAAAWRAPLTILFACTTVAVCVHV